MNQEQIDKHLCCSRTNKSEIGRLLRPLFSNSQVTFFGYNRFYRDTKWIGIYSDDSIVQYDLSIGGGPLFVDSNGIGIDDGFYINGDLQEILRLQVDEQKINDWFEQKGFETTKKLLKNGLMIIRKGHEYDESFFFSLLEEKLPVRAYYYHYLNHLKKYCLYFLQKGKNLISYAEKYKIPYPVNETGREKFNDMFSLLSDELGKDDWINVGKYCFSTPYGDTYLSKQELNCLRLLAKGYSYNEISKHLDLSYKTVESYIQNIKNKLSTGSKSELIEYYNYFSSVDFAVDDLVST